MAEKKKPVKPVGGSPEPLSVPIELVYPDGLVGRYANHAIVQIGAHECNLLFFEVRPPLLMGSPEEVQEQAKGIKSVSAECVSRIVVPINIMPAFLAAITETMGKHAARTSAETEIKGVGNDNG